MILIAKNKHGYQNLCKIVSKAWVDGYYNRPRIDKDLLVQYREDLIVCSACLGGELPQKILEGIAKGGDFSEAEILTTLYFYEMNISPENASV